MLMGVGLVAEIDFEVMTALWTLDFYVACISRVMLANLISSINPKIIVLFD